MRNIGVFMSGKDNLPDSFVSAANNVGTYLGKTGRTMVYGGARKGLMEVMAKAVRKNGGKVFGVVPQLLSQRGEESDEIDVTFNCVDLNDRKSIMMRESEAFIVMPGGIGTLDEMFCVLASNAFGQSNKRVVLYDVDSCWMELMEMLSELRHRGLIEGHITGTMSIVSNIDELDKALS